jgi:hypothetical protein
LYGLFELKGNGALTDGISSGIPALVIMCDGKWVNSKLLSPVVLGKASAFTAHDGQQTVYLRADSKVRVHNWNMAEDFRTFFVDKGATKELLGSNDARIQFRDVSEHELVAMFSPSGINQEMLIKACGNAFK